MTEDPEKSGSTDDPKEDEELPEPEIETIRNFAALSEEVLQAINDGAVLTLDGEAVHDHAIGVNVLSGVLVHFDRLFRILQAVKSGLQVKRSGRVADVVGAKHFAALPALKSSYALPLRLEAPQGELVGDDRQALEEVMKLLSSGSESELRQELGNLPERVGDELFALLRELAGGGADLRVQAIREGSEGGSAVVSARAAKSRANWLSSLVDSAVGSETVQGKLFRIDTKRGRIAVDSYEGEESEIVEALFDLKDLETLKKALNQPVEIEVEVVEEKRPYEQTARNRLMKVNTVRLLDEPEQSGTVDS
jgi:hypothetical protein